MASTIEDLKIEYYSGKVDLREFITQAERIIKKFNLEIDPRRLRRNIIKLVGRL